MAKQALKFKITDYTEQNSTMGRHALGDQVKIVKSAQIFAEEAFLCKKVAQKKAWRG